MFGLFLETMAGPLAKRVAGALGFGIVSYAGVEFTVSSLLTAAATAFIGLPATVAVYLAVAGVPGALAIIAGAIAMRAALAALKKFAQL